MGAINTADSMSATTVKSVYRDNYPERTGYLSSDLNTIGIIANVALFGRSRDPAVLLDTIKRIASAVAEGQAKLAELTNDDKIKFDAYMASNA